MKIIVDGKEMEIEEPDNMFKQIDGKWYAKVYNEKSIEELQKENNQLKDFLGLLEANIRINHDDIQINLYKKLLQIFKDLKDLLGDKE